MAFVRFSTLGEITLRQAILFVHTHTHSMEDRLLIFDYFSIRMQRQQHQTFSITQNSEERTEENDVLLHRHRLYIKVKEREELFVDAQEQPTFHSH